MRPVGPARLQTGVKPLGKGATHTLAAWMLFALMMEPCCRESSGLRHIHHGSRNGFSGLQGLVKIFVTTNLRTIKCKFIQNTL